MLGLIIQRLVNGSVHPAAGGGLPLGFTLRVINEALCESGHVYC